MKPIEHSGCAQFDDALLAKSIVRADQGFYVTWIEWDQVPPEMVDQLRGQLDTMRATQNLPAGQELKPFILLAKCPFCEVSLVDQGLPE